MIFLFHFSTLYKTPHRRVTDNPASLSLQRQLLGIKAHVLKVYNPIGFDSVPLDSNARHHFDIEEWKRIQLLAHWLYEFLKRNTEASLHFGVFGTHHPN